MSLLDLYKSGSDWNSLWDYKSFWTNENYSEWTIYKNYNQIDSEILSTNNFHTISF